MFLIFCIAHFWQDFINPNFNYRLRHIFAELCNTISHQAIELESSSNPLWIQQVFQFRLKKIVRFGHSGDNVIMMACFRHLAKFTCPWAPIQRALVLAQVFGNWAIIRVFRAFFWLSSGSGAKNMGQKTVWSCLSLLGPFFWWNLKLVG